MRFDYKDPDYAAIFAERSRRLKKLREDPRLVQAAKIHYRDNPWDFITDWGMTFEPRNLERGLLASIPFVIWPKQREYLEWLYAMWLRGERGLVEKSRDCGVTWLSVGFAVNMWLFRDGFTAGFGSAKEDKIDRKGDPDSIFEKIRFFINNLPVEFLPVGFNERECIAHMKIINPANGGTITGEAGDNIGRGGRKSIYLVDEAAFIERQQLVDASLSQTTNCQVDISTPNGNGNPFYKKRMRFEGTDKLFIFDWRDDPRKDEAWYQRMKQEHDEVTVAQEIDRDYNASAEDAFIPAKWVAASIDAHKVLGFEPQGIRTTGFDPADVGDAKATVCRHGSIVRQARQRNTGDVTTAIPWAINEADEFRADVLGYDADGMGAPSMKLSAGKLTAGRFQVQPYYGSAGVEDPKGIYGEDHAEHKTAILIGKMKPKMKRDAELKAGNLRTNADTFVNYRAQTWTAIRNRFELTYHAVERARQGQAVMVDPANLISISSECDEMHQLQAELSRPMRKYKNGMIMVESKAEMKKRGVDSPNLADALVIAYSVTRAEPEKSQTFDAGAFVASDPGMGY